MNDAINDGEGGFDYAEETGLDEFERAGTF